MMINDVDTTEKEVLQLNTEETIDKDQNPDTQNLESKSKPQRDPIPIGVIDILPDYEEYEKIPVIVELPYYLIKKLQANVNLKWGKNDCDINSELEQMIKKFNSNFGLKTPPLHALKFEGREPRKDVLLKLRKIAGHLEFEEGYPWLGLRQIKRCINEALENPDPRTLEKYYRCIKNYIQSIKGQERISVGDTHSVACLSDVVEEKLMVMSTGNGRY